jgi:hypothetical protein
MLAAYCFYICILSEHVIINKNVVPACLQNTSGLTMCKLRILQNLQPVGRQPDANFIQSAASRMQISFSWPPAECKLHPASGLAIQNTQRKFINSLHVAGDQPNEICIRLTASWMQIL